MRSANFVEETTTSIAGTSGDGAVTLTAITNVPRFSTVFGAQDTTIRYVIEDTVNKKFEIGIGSVAANVLTRTRPQITWNGTTYDDSTPAALQFGATPTSGNIKIRLAATAESQGVVMPGTLTTLGMNGYEYSGNIRGDISGSNPALAANREYYLPYLLNLSGLLDGFEVNVGAADSGKSIKSALYNCGTNGLPGSKIVDFNVISLASTGSKTDTTTSTWSTGGPVWLPAGWYYIGLISDSSSAAIFSLGGTGQQVTRNPLGRRNSYGYGDCVYAAGTYSTGLPANPSPTTYPQVTSAMGFSPRLRVLP